MMQKYLPMLHNCLATCLATCLLVCSVFANTAAADTTAIATATEGVAHFEEGLIPASDGVELYYRKRGDGGQTVIVPSRLFNWDQLSFLGDHFTYISYDMRNRGRSASVKDGSVLTLEKDVEDMEAVRAHFGAETFSTLGYSYLGKVVIMYARAHPDRIERIVQVGPVPSAFSNEYPEEVTAAALPSPFPPDEIERLNELREAGVKESEPRRYCEVFWEIIPYQLVGDPANVDKINPDYCDMENEWPVNIDFHMQHAFVESAMTHVLTDEEIAKVTAPVLTIHGTFDRNAPYGAGREWAIKLPNARLITIKGAGHHVWADDPTVNDDILTFLQGEWPERAEVVTSLLPD